MDNITLAHVGGELVIIGGIVYYFHKKYTNIQDQVNYLKSENEELRALIEELQEGMQQLGAMVMKQTNSPPQRSTPTTQPIQSTLRETMNVSHKTPKRRRRIPKSDTEDSGNETYDDRDLDSELAGEFKELDTQRCQGDFCDLKE